MTPDQLRAAIASAREHPRMYGDDPGDLESYLHGLVHPVSAEAAATARRIGRIMLALGREPRTFPAPDEVPADATRGGCSVEVNEADVHISADGRVWSVVTGAEGDDDD